MDDISAMNNGTGNTTKEVFVSPRKAILMFLRNYQNNAGERKGSNSLELLFDNRIRGMTKTEDFLSVSDREGKEIGTIFYTGRKNGNVAAQHVYYFMLEEHLAETTNSYIKDIIKFYESKRKNLRNRNKRIIRETKQKAEEIPEKNRGCKVQQNESSKKPESSLPDDFDAEAVYKRLKEKGQVF